MRSQRPFKKAVRTHLMGTGKERLGPKTPQPISTEIVHGCLKKPLQMLFLVCMHACINLLLFIMKAIIKPGQLRARASKPPFSKGKRGKQSGNPQKASFLLSLRATSTCVSRCLWPEEKKNTMVQRYPSLKPDRYLAFYECRPYSFDFIIGFPIVVLLPFTSLRFSCNSYFSFFLRRSLN